MSPTKWQMPFSVWESLLLIEFNQGYQLPNFHPPNSHWRGCSVMMKELNRSRHPIQMTWPCEQLLCKCAIAIACAVEPGSTASCSSAVKSYFNFCSTHSFPVDPTPDILIFYAVYTAHYIKPNSVSLYLSGICNQLEPFFPEVQTSRHHWLVKKTLLEDA